jgi:hypothetical protein
VNLLLYLAARTSVRLARVSMRFGRLRWTGASRTTLALAERLVEFAEGLYSRLWERNDLPHSLRLRASRRQEEEEE